MILSGPPAEFGRDLGSTKMRLLALVLPMVAAALLAECRMRTDEVGVTPTSPAASSSTGGRANVDSSSSGDADETISPGELERELDRLERELGSAGRGGRGR